MQIAIEKNCIDVENRENVEKEKTTLRENNFNNFEPNFIHILLL